MMFSAWQSHASVHNIFVISNITWRKGMAYCSVHTYLGSMICNEKFAAALPFKLSIFDNEMQMMENASV